MVNRFVTQKCLVRSVVPMFFITRTVVVENLINTRRAKVILNYRLNDLIRHPKTWTSIRTVR